MDKPVMYRNGKSRKQRELTLEHAVRLIRSATDISTRHALTKLAMSTVQEPVMVGIVDQVWLLED